MKVTKAIEIDMGHAVTNHKSKCKHLHGHRYKIIATVDDRVQDEGSSDGMVIDFSDLKEAMMVAIDSPFDHAFVIWDQDPRAIGLQEAHRLWHNDIGKFHLLTFVPTAENLAKRWFELLNSRLLPKKILLYQIEVYETPTSSAIYTIND